MTDDFHLTPSRIHLTRRIGPHGHRCVGIGGTKNLESSAKGEKGALGSKVLSVVRVVQSQQRAVCPFEDHVYLTQGSPGTGKSHLATALAAVASGCSQCPVLTCAPTDFAVGTLDGLADASDSSC